ncbi:MAG: NUDIX hydrolase [Deltaproteobacteria bacterium]|nr:MAG: NUDIX hydrolase [Deltaproteobacteria bacterium]
MAASQTTAAVPVRPAATVMIVDDRPDLHVLLLRRRVASQFVPGMDVFPGGGVDAHDGAPEGAPVDLDDAGASARLGIARGGLAYWAAATRETYEEAGLRLAIGALHYAAHWITPPGPPRRYDTRFFVAALPAGQTPVADQDEAVHAEWVQPARALADFAAGARAILPPTAGMLRILASYPSAAELLRAAARAESAPDRRVRLASAGGAWRVLLPGESGGPQPGERITEMEAWVRLPLFAREE